MADPGQGQLDFQRQSLGAEETELSEQQVGPEPPIPGENKRIPEDQQLPEPPEEHAIIPLLREPALRRPLGWWKAALRREVGHQLQYQDAESKRAAARRPYRELYGGCSISPGC
jgi:hypothetical protein